MEHIIDFVNKNPDSLNERDSKMRTPIMAAAMIGSTSVLEHLIKLHPDPASAVSATDAADMTASDLVTLAAASGSISPVEAEHVQAILENFQPTLNRYRY